MICARKSLVQGMRMVLFRLRHDGTYKKKSQNGKNKETKVKMATSRFLVVAWQMRFFRLHGGGEEEN